MRKFYAMIRMAMICLVLCACHGPQLQPSVPEATACASHPGQPWRTWKVVQRSPIVQTLITDQGAVWAGTSLGVFRVDLRSGAVTQSLDSKAAGEVRKLFPLGKGRLWADGTNGPFYYDGRQWAPLNITGTLGVPEIWAVDLNGDVCVREYHSRMNIYYRLSGHIPPRAPNAWKATRTDWCADQYTIGRCELQVFISSGFSFRSQAECQALNKAFQQVRASVALDADRSIWWLRSETVDQKNRRTVLGHILPSQSSLTQTVPAESVYAMAADPSHGVWLGTEKELFYSDGYQVRQVSLRPSACTIPFSPSGLDVDSQGRAWIAGYGVCVLSPGETEWQHTSESAQAGPESARFITAIAPARDGGMWATRGYDLLHLGGSITMKPTQVPEPQCLVRHLMEGVDSVWMLSDCGILRFIVSSATWGYPFVKGYDVATLAIGSDGTVYAPGQKDLYAYSSSEWRLVAETKDLTDAAADRQGGIWIASREQGELWYYKSGQLTPHGQQFDKQVLQGLTVDSRNRLWAALRDGLLFYDGKTWRRISAPLENIAWMQSGRDGHIWVIGRDSIAEYNPAADKQP